MTCPRCGANLHTGHRFCWNCGLARPDGRAPDRAEAGRVPAVVGLVALLAAAGSVFFLVSVVQELAWIVHPGGIAELRRQSIQSGMSPVPSLALFTAYLLLFFALSLGIALLHLATFVFLQRRSATGWVLAVALSALWSLALVGIPFLVVLLRSSTRRAFGLT